MSIVYACMVPHPPIILPEIGGGKEAEIAATDAAYRRVASEIARRAPRTVIISSPHAVMYSDYFHISPGSSASGDFERFGAPQVKLDCTYDTALVNSICALCDAEGFPAGTQGERDRSLDHATMIPLYYLRAAYKAAGKTEDYKVVRLGLSGLELPQHYHLGQLIRQACDACGYDVAYIASGDLSHKLKADGPYGYAEEGPKYDKRIMEVMGSGEFGGLLDFGEDFLEAAAECGHRSFTIMAGALDGVAVTASALSHQGNFGVGYGVCEFIPGKSDESRRFLDIYEKKEDQPSFDALPAGKGNEDEYVRLARASVEYYVRHGSPLPLPAGLSDGLTGRRAGAFVTLHEDGDLRGCIGTIRATKSSLAREILDNAVEACSHDPRFDAVKESELPQLVYSVDVLGFTEPVGDLSQLDPKRYGVIVTRGGRRGLLLPNLDGVDTVGDQIAIAKRKAGIRQDQDVTLERFEVVRHF